MDHDRLFKELLTTFFLDFLKVFCPQLARYLDPAWLEFLNMEVFTDVTHGERHAGGSGGEDQVPRKARGLPDPRRSAGRAEEEFSAADVYLLRPLL